MKQNPLAVGCLAFLVALAVAASASAATKDKLPEGAKVVALEATPAEIALAQQICLRASAGHRAARRGRSGRRHALVAPTVSGELAVVSPTGVVRPKADGDGTIGVSLAGQSIAVPLKVSGQKADYKTSFVRDVMPALSKMGCNAGTCHGSLNGKNGFKLSLRGYDPLYDHRALTDDIASRRINRAAPDQSLMLLKPSGVIPHVGGVLTQAGPALLRVGAFVDRRRREARSRQPARGDRSTSCPRIRSCPCRG